MTLFADLADLEKHRTVPTEQVPAAEDLLELASAKIRTRFPTIDERILAGELDVVLPRGAAIRMVSEVLSNPDRFVSEQVEETTFRLDAQLVRSYMELSASEIEDMSPPPVSSAGRPRFHHTTPCW